MSTEKQKKSFIAEAKEKIKVFWEKYEQKIVLAVGLILIAFISFETGVLKGQDWNQPPLIIEKPAGEVSLGCVAGESDSKLKEENSTIASTSTFSERSVSNSVENKKECAFVGSKNSNKYHIPDCRWAKQIKPENIVCFKSEEDAQIKGYVPCSCARH